MITISPKLKLLVVCSKNQWRSPTAERIYRDHPQIEVRSAGTSPQARHRISIKDIRWADHILCMEEKHQQLISNLFPQTSLPPIKVLDIPDHYSFMDPELIEIFHFEIENLLKTPH